MTTPKPIGHLFKTSYSNYRAQCVECDWTLDKRDQDEAARSMRGHADIRHPQPIPVYREDTTP